MKQLLALMTGIILMTACAEAHTPDSSHDSSGKITVSATGQSFQAPDTAMVSAGVVTQGATAGAAMQANASQMTRTIDALLAAGIERRHIQTSSLTLQPRYDYQDRRSPTITGYEARNTVRAKSEDIETVGAMLDALVSAGANNISGVNFGIKDSEAAQSAARKEAIKKARAKAQEMAMAAGVGLGDIVSISEGGGYSQPQPMMMARGMAMDEAVSTPVEAGEQSLSVTVNMTFTILQ